jgi:hypothetical protein
MRDVDIAWMNLMLELSKYQDVKVIKLRGGNPAFLVNNKINNAIPKIKNCK